MDFRLLHLIATVIDACERPRDRGRGHPPTATVRVLATLRRFLREGTPWRSLIATEDQASGSTLRRCLANWAKTGLLAKVHALLVGMLRGHPDLILDSCSVRAKRGGDLTGPNPTDRGKQGTKYHIATDGDGVPVACAATAANLNDTLVFERLFRAPSRSWRASARCSRTRATTPSTTGICAGASAPSPGSTSVDGHADRAWASGAGRSSAATPGCWRTSAAQARRTNGPLQKGFSLRRSHFCQGWRSRGRRPAGQVQRKSEGPRFARATLARVIPMSAAPLPSRSTDSSLVASSNRAWELPEPVKPATPRKAKVPCSRP